MENKVYKPKIVVGKDGKVYTYDYNKYKEHAQAHMRINAVVDKEARAITQQEFYKKTRTCSICNMTMNYFSMCNHLKSKHHLAEVEKIRIVDQFLNADQFIDE